ncbi:hypothetical protein KAM344_41520 [Aeromonas caviae]|nr:hypothetical protein KAM344_41520 [Aeromonas caviae]
MELNVELRVHESDLNVEPEHSMVLSRMLHYINIYFFIKTLAAFDADFNSNIPMEHKQSIFNKMMPTYPLDKWVPHQGEIVNILLKIKNSFLPTKQILIGL